MSIFWILLTVLALGLLVMVHELAHMLVAKAFHMEVFEYSIGFGPKLWQRRSRSGTRYSLRALPLGGYVAFDDPGDADAENLAFRRYPVGHRFWVLLAGSLMNLVTAVLLAAVVLLAWGTQEAIPTVESVYADYPAQAAGLQAGDEILFVNGTAVAGDYAAFSQALTEAGGGELALVVRRDGEELSLTVTPMWVEAENRYMIGMTAAQRTVRVPFFSAMKTAFLWTVSMIGELFVFLGGLFRGRGTEDVSSIVGAVQVVAESGQTYGLSAFLTVISYLSINLGVMNLLPLPVVDGGKILLLAVEKLRGKALSVEKEGVINLVGILVFGALFVLLTFRDVGRIIGG